MPTITFIKPDGTTQKVTGTAGDTVLKIALDNGLPMEGACGGNGFCTTCLCEVTGDVSPRGDREENMGITDEPQRLGCQTHVQGDATVKILEN